MKKKFLLVKQPHESMNKRTLAYALLFTILFLSTSFANSTFILGYGFADLRENNNQSFLALGVAPYDGTYLCANAISFLPNMAMSGKMIPADYVEMRYQGALSPLVVCYKNYTCILKYFDGSYYATISSSDPLSTFLNMTNVTTLMSYRGQCVVFDKLGGNATTEDRYLSIIGPQGINNVTVTNITNVLNITNLTPGRTNTVDVISVIAVIIILLFIAGHFGEMPILSVFASLLLIIVGIFVSVDGIVYPVGNITGGSNSAFKGGSSNISGNITFINESEITYLNETTAVMYAKMTVPIIDFSATLGLILILLGMFFLLTYALKFAKDLSGKG